MSAILSPEERRQLRRRATDQNPCLPSPPGLLPGDEPWRCVEDLIGARVEAADGPIGRVTDIEFEEETCAITGLVVTTEDASLVVPLGAIARIDWPQQTLYLATKL